MNTDHTNEHVAAVDFHAARIRAITDMCHEADFFRTELESLCCSAMVVLGDDHPILHRIQRIHHVASGRYREYRTSLSKESQRMNEKAVMSLREGDEETTSLPTKRSVPESTT